VEYSDYKNICAILFDSSSPYLIQKLTESADYQMAKEIDDLQKQNAALQAKVDSLMLEYCPDEMTREQLDNWGKHQEPSNKIPADRGRDAERRMRKKEYTSNDVLQARLAGKGVENDQRN